MESKYKPRGNIFRTKCSLSFSLPFARCSFEQNPNGILRLSMRDFIHRFYPYQALKLMLQRWRPAHRIRSSSVASSPTSSSKLTPQAAAVEPFDPDQARSQLVSYFRALKHAQITFATHTLSNNNVAERQLQSLRQSISHKELGFHLEVAPSRIPSAGLGLFLREGKIALAEAQKAVLFELRAATSLYRVRPKATRARLARLIGRFAPADHCVDVNAATALLGI